MRRVLAALVLLAAAPATGQDAATTDAATSARVIEAVAASGFKGTYAVYQGPRRIVGGSAGPAIEGQPGGFEFGAAWPWASVTKQVVATLVMQEVEKGRLSLDMPASRYLPRHGARAPTLRQLLQHHAGLRNPEDSAPDAAGTPSFYTTGPTGLDWCLAGRGAAGGAWRYNNCDYIVLGAVLERVTRLPLPELFAQRIAGPLGLTAGFIAPDATAPDARWPGGPSNAERQAIARYGAAGALVGTATDLVTFDRALLSGALLTEAARAQLWRADPALGQMALGQWVYDAPLAGCAAPVRIVERRGAIGRFAVRNVILPAQGMSIVLFTNRGDPEDGSGAFGEVWQGRGITHRILSAAACA